MKQEWNNGGKDGHVTQASNSRNVLVSSTPVPLSNLPFNRRGNQSVLLPLTYWLSRPRTMADYHFQWRSTGSVFENQHQLLTRERPVPSVLHCFSTEPTYVTVFCKVQNLPCNSEMANTFVLKRRISLLDPPRNATKKKFFSKVVGDGRPTLLHKPKQTFDKADVAENLFSTEGPLTNSWDLDFINLLIKKSDQLEDKLDNTCSYLNQPVEEEKMSDV
ncbi:unnamed protein product [Enterobius vermicularis]|uniref:C2 calcium-dependent domain-containing protein 4C n=1 Tax=Enterobius vermicularis TaxID=51028 RepID=A0A0N4UTU7_ENTVE|nr:unnamed protein product [Enterobius vermicularis]